MRVNGLLALAVLGLLLATLGAGEQAKLDPAKLLGTWKYVGGEKDGKKINPADYAKGSVEFSKENIMLKSPDGNFVIKYKLDPTKNPCQISMEITEGPQGKGATATGIIELKGDTLKLCYPAMGGGVPKDFAAPEGSKNHLFVLKKK